jgi:hypothetical protein
VLKMVALAHDSNWGLLTTGWGGWYLVEIAAVGGCLLADPAR